MTDRALVDKKLAFIETCVRELRELARPEVIDEDIREARFIEHTLQLAIQAALEASAVAFCEHHGFPRFPDRPDRLFLPMNTIAKL